MKRQARGALDQVRDALGPSQRYVGPIAVARGRDRHAYLLLGDTDNGDTVRVKRWIPSRVVLASLRLSALDIAVITDEQLGAYHTGPPLLNHKEVALARDCLKRYRRPGRLPKIMESSQVRIAGHLKSVAAPRAADYDGIAKLLAHTGGLKKR